MSIQNWSDFKFDDIIFKPPTKNTMGGQNVYLDTNASKKTNPTFQLPRCQVPFGLDRNEQSQSTRFNLELSVRDPEFFKTMNLFDDRVIKEAAKHSKEWFGKTYTATKIQDMEIYRNSIKGTLDGPYPPLFRIKVPSERNVPKVYVLNRSETGKESWTAGTLQDINKGCHVVPIVECSGVWFVSKKSFGLSFVAKHILVEKNDEENSFPFVGVDAEQAMDIEEEDDDTKIINNII